MPNSKPYTPKPETQARLIRKQAVKIYPEDPELQERFVTSVLSGTSALPALFWTGPPQALASRQVADWQPDFVSVPDATTGGHDPRHVAGAYYLLDFSSVVSASVVLAIREPVRTILDLCAAPGGKGIFAWRALSPEILISNEVIAKRAGMLITNLQRCHVSGASVVRFDPSQLAKLTPQTFELTIVDAPCSGQSLIAKGETAAGAFQPNLISGNMTRQRRILAEAAATVAPGGHLAYMTCTYSREENEKNVEWLLRRFPDFVAVEVPHLDGIRSELADFPCYRHAPQGGMGVGGFVALLKNKVPGDTQTFNLSALRPIWRSPVGI